jgi:lysine 2,3-aminomutase
MWQDARWQRRNSVTDVGGLRRVFGSALPDDLADDIARDQRGTATMRLRVPPHALNTMDECDLWRDPIRRYMAPAHDDRRSSWPSHPCARRDSLDELGSWTVDGLVHRYPRKVMLELTTTCPQYCGHCTRMDLVGPSTNEVKKRAFALRRDDRYEQMLAYLAAHSEIYDVVVSGGDVANVPIARLERFCFSLLEIPHVRSVRLASKSLISFPQYFLDPAVTATLGRLAETARARGVDLALHTQANHANQVTTLVARAVERLLELGFRDIRNQGVLLRGVNATASDVLALSEALYGARMEPYYLYVCDMIPGAEHWRTSISHAQQLQRSLMGKLPGFATPRVICDVPLVGKRQVDQLEAYDRELGISWWRREADAHRQAQSQDGDTRYPYYDPIDTLPLCGQSWWATAAAGPGRHAA